jgi:small-conductance mechanosensitive channel
MLQINKMLKNLKKPLSIGLIFFISTFLEIYWAVGEFSGRMSSGNPDASFFDDAYLMSLFTTIFLTIVFLFLSLIKNIYFKVTIQFIFLISVWFFWNYAVFVDRESSWSTYRFNEELHYTLSVSILPILVLSIPTIFGLNYILKSHEPK